MAGPPVMVLPINTKRETGRTAQLGNISAAKAVSEIIRTTLGPRSMLKMLLDPMGGIVITNDGNCILREVDVSHPAAKSMIELSRAQDEEVGDGTTSVIILAGEMLAAAEPLLLQHLHPTQIVRGYAHALQVALETCTAVSKVVDLKDRAALKELVEAAVGTKFSHRWGDILVGMAIDAVTKVVCDVDGRTEVVCDVDGRTEVDVKRYVRVEKVPGGELDQCRVLDGVMFNKDVTHARMRRRIESPRILLLDCPLEYKKGESATNVECTLSELVRVLDSVKFNKDVTHARMRRRIESPRILLLDCPLEYKKGESATNVEVTQEDDWNTLLRMEEEYVENICAQIVAFKPDIVITEKGVSDLAQHYFMKANITCFRRLRKSDNNRVARAVGATIVSRPDEIQESDIGTGCGLFEVRKIGDEYFAFLEQCKDPKACTVLLRGGSKDVLNEVERNLQDAMQVVRNVVFEPRLLPGGGATEMAVAAALTRAAEAADGAQRWPVAAVAGAFEAIPRTLAQNCGASVVRTLTQLRAKHAAPAAAAEGGGAGAAAAAAHTGVTWGINGVTGELADMDTLGVWEPYSVKVQTYKTAIEAACMILRIDDIVSGVKTKR